MRHSFLAANGLAALALAASALPAAGGTLEEVWRATGFETPESVLFDPATGAIFVSNINGAPDAVDGNGYISRLGADGTVEDLKWLEGLDAPKGMAVVGGRLFVADIAQIVEIDIATGTVAGRYPAEGAAFLNDVTADSAGRVYVSDSFTSAIYVLADRTVTRWVQDAALLGPNGLTIDAEGGRLIVAGLGDLSQGFENLRPGHVQTVDLATGAVGDLGSAEPVGALDGIEPDGAGGYYVSDFFGGRLLHLAADGTFEELGVLAESGTADIGYRPDEGLILVPLMMDGAVVAVRVVE